MSKKRLSDLLRAEAQKTSSESSAEGADAQIDAEQAQESQQPDGDLQVTASPSGSSPSGRKSRPTKADLEVTIAELRQSLESIQGERDDLQAHLEVLQSSLQGQEDKVQMLQTNQEQQLTALQAALEAEQKRVQELLAQVGQVDQLKTELEAAKKLILELSKTNTQTPSSQRPLPSVVATPPSQPKSPVPQQRLVPERRRPGPPVLPNNSSSALSNEEIGWFD